VVSEPPVILIGAGGHARVLIDVLRRLDRGILFATEDDPELHGSDISGVPIRGADERILEHHPGSIGLVNAVGSVGRPSTRRRVFERFNDRGYRFESVIHPSAVVAASVELGEGVQVMAGAVIQPGVRIGTNVLVNTCASLDHDCVVAPHTHVAPGVTLSGGVRIGEAAHIGTGAVVIQGIEIGNGAIVGAGGVVVRNVPPGVTVVGVPAGPIREGRDDGDDRIDGRDGERA
jgi:UDP-perosamine 4-acetyltransferase